VGGLPTNRTVNGFAVNPEDPNIMFVAMRNGLFKSTDAGASWKNVGSELKSPAAVAINPKKSTEIYLSTTDGAIYMSADAGMKWKKQR
jgi:photosystem II stability/assembly factor-like uncharacterized protein